jgi:hypothetical protein
LIYFAREKQIRKNNLLFLINLTKTTGCFLLQRTGGRLAEIDYVIQHRNNIIPVEVKSGAAGKMKSLHQFIAEKNYHLLSVLI